MAVAEAGIEGIVLKHKPEMRLIPAGKFMMGDPTEEGDPDERPRHEVEVSEFLMDEHDTTFAFWKEVKEWATAHGYQFDNEGKGREEDHPVTDVNWYDGVKWCNARSEMEKLEPCYYTDIEHKNVYKTGRVDLTNAMVKWDATGYRLPTEAEYEKAARGGLDGHHFPWESKGPGFEQFIDKSKANYFGNEGGTTSVKKYKPNGFGLYDMVGNVWKWMWDRWDSEWYKKPESTAKDCKGPDA